MSVLKNATEGCTGPRNWLSSAPLPNCVQGHLLRIPSPIDFRDGNDLDNRYFRLFFCSKPL